MLKNDTHKIQSTLADFCRSGEPIDLPGTTEGRLAQYRRLVFGVISNTLSQAYPIAAKHLGSEIWDQLIEDFFANHACQDPQVWRMPRELIDYVRSSGYDKTLKLPHLLDLLKMEWLEIEVHAMPDVNEQNRAPIDDLVNNVLVFNPYYRLERFTYPVHKIHERNPADFPGNYFLLIFRQTTGHQRVQFIALQPIFAVLIDTILQNKHVSAIEAFEALKQSGPIAMNNTDLTSLNKLLSHLVEKNFILGQQVH